MLLPLLLSYVLREAPMELPRAEPVTSIVETGTGILAVQAGSVTQANAAIRGATRVPFLTLRVSAECDADVSLDALTLHHRGLGDARDVSNVYVLDGHERVSTTNVFQRKSNTAHVRFRDIVIARCSSRMFTVAGDIDAAAAIGGEHRIELHAVSDIESSARQTHLTKQSAASRIRTAPSAAGSIAVSFLPANDRPSYGRRINAARFSLEATGDRDHLVSAITLTNRGTARDADLVSLSLETSRGERVTDVVSSLDGRIVTLTFDPPFLLERHDTRILLLKATVRGSIRRTISFFVEENGDVMATTSRRRR